MSTNGTINWSASEAGQHLYDRLNSEKTIRSLDHLLDRIDTLEKAVEKLTGLMEHGPGLVAMTADMVDETYKQAQANGVQIEERLNAALQVADRLTQPQMVEQLNGLMDTAQQLPGLVAMAGDMADETYRNAQSNGIQIEERLTAALQIAGRLTEPQMVDQLNGLLDTAQQLPGLIAMTVDMVDEGYQGAADNGLDIAALSELGSKTAQALAESKDQPIKKVGTFGLLKALSDPDRQKALGFLMNFTKALGKKL